MTALIAAAIALAASGKMPQQGLRFHLQRNGSEIQAARLEVVRQYYILKDLEQKTKQQAEVLAAEQLKLSQLKEKEKK